MFTGYSAAAAYCPLPPWHLGSNFNFGLPQVNCSATPTRHTHTVSRVHASFSAGCNHLGHASRLIRTKYLFSQIEIIICVARKQEGSRRRGRERSQRGSPEHRVNQRAAATWLTAWLRLGLAACPSACLPAPLSLPPCNNVARRQRSNFSAAAIVVFVSIFFFFCFLCAILNTFSAGFVDIFTWPPARGQECRGECGVEALLVCCKRLKRG